MTATATAPETLSRQLVVFSLGEEEYALPITQVQEIIRYTEPRGVASDTPWIRGVISLRGKIVPVCDLGSRLGLSFQPAQDAKIVIIETGQATAGVIVDEVEEVLTIDSDQLDPVPGTSTDLIDTIAKVEDRLIILLNPTTLFSGIELAGAGA